MRIPKQSWRELVTFISTSSLEKSHPSHPCSITRDHRSSLKFTVILPIKVFQISSLQPARGTARVHSLRKVSCTILCFFLCFRIFCWANFPSNGKQRNYLQVNLILAFRQEQRSEMTAALTEWETAQVLWWSHWCTNPHPGYWSDGHATHPQTLV